MAGLGSVANMKLGFNSIEEEDPEKIAAFYIAYSSKIKETQEGLLYGQSKLDIKYKVLSERILPIIDNSLDDEKHSLFHVVFDPSSYANTLENIECIRALIHNYILKFLPDDDGADTGPLVLRIPDEERHLHPRDYSGVCTTEYMFSLFPFGKWKDMCEAQKDSGKPIFLTFDRQVTVAELEQVSLQTVQSMIKEEQSSDEDMDDDIDMYYDDDEMEEEMEDKETVKETNEYD